MVQLLLDCHQLVLVLELHARGCGLAHFLKLTPLVEQHRHPLLDFYELCLQASLVVLDHLLLLRRIW